MMQVNNLEKFLTWVKSSPCQFTISSMSNNHIHAKFLVPCDKAIPTTEDRDELMSQCYEDGFQDGRLDTYHKDHTETKS